MADIDPALQSSRTASGGWKKFFHFDWIRTPLGLLKIGQLVIVLIALIVMSSVRNIAGSGISSIEFFYFIHSTVLILVFITLLLYIVNLYYRLPTIIISNIVMTVCCGIGAAMHLISSAVVMDKYAGEDVILAAGSFGLIAFFLFLFETAFYFIMWRKKGPYVSSAVSVVNDVPEPPVTTVY